MPTIHAKTFFFLFEDDGGGAPKIVCGINCLLSTLYTCYLLSSIKFACSVRRRENIDAFPIPLYYHPWYHKGFSP